MALKMLYRGPSTRLETLIEKIQQNTNAFGVGGMIAPGALGGGIGAMKEFSLGQGRICRVVIMAQKRSSGVLWCELRKHSK